MLEGIRLGRKVTEVIKCSEKHVLEGKRNGMRTRQRSHPSSSTQVEQLSNFCRGWVRSPIERTNAYDCRLKGSSKGKCGFEFATTPRHHRLCRSKPGLPFR